MVIAPAEVHVVNNEGKMTPGKMAGKGTGRKTGWCIVIYRNVQEVDDSPCDHGGENVSYNRPPRTETMDLLRLDLCPAYKSGPKDNYSSDDEQPVYHAGFADKLGLVVRCRLLLLGLTLWYGPHLRAGREEDDVVPEEDILVITWHVVPLDAQKCVAGPLSCPSIGGCLWSFWHRRF